MFQLISEWVSPDAFTIASLNKRFRGGSLWDLRSLLFFFMLLLILETSGWCWGEEKVGSLFEQLSGELDDAFLQVHKYKKLASIKTDKTLSEIRDDLPVTDVLVLSRKAISIYKRAHEYEKAIGLADAGIQLSRKASLPFWETQMLIEKGDLYRWMDEYDLALNEITKAEDIAFEIQDRICLADLYNLKGNVEKDRNDELKARTYFLSALNYAEALDDQNEAGRIYLNLGDLFRHSLDQEKAVYYYSRALEVFEKTDDKKAMAKVLDRITVLYSSRSEFELALNTAYRSLQIYVNADDIKGIINIKNRIGGIFRRMNQYDRSLKFTLEAFDLAERIHYQEGILSATKELGLIYERLNLYEDALKYSQQGLAVAENEHAVKYTASANRSIGGIYFYLKRYDEALYKLQTALKLYYELEDYRGVASTLLKLGKVDFELGHSEVALSHYEEALSVSKKSQNYWLEASSYVAMGEFFWDSDIIDNAEMYLKMSLEPAEKSSNKDAMLDSYRLLFEIMSKTGRLGESSIYARHYIKLRDSMNNKEIQQRITQLLSYHAVEKKQEEINRLKVEEAMRNLELKAKEQKIELLHKDNNLKKLVLEQEKWNKRFYIGILCLLLLLIIALGSRYRYAKRMQKLLQGKNERIESQNNKLQEINASKDRLFTILSHDLKDSVGNLISSISLLNKHAAGQLDRDSSRLLKALFKSSQGTLGLLQNLLDWSKVQMTNQMPRLGPVFLFELCDRIVSNYANVIGEKELQLNLDIKDRLVVLADAQMLESILRNLIRNAIKFTPSCGCIHLFAESHNDDVCIHVKDNGIGMTQKRADQLFSLELIRSTLGTHGEQGNGIGLILCDELLKRQGSQLIFQTRPDSGSDFYFSLRRLNPTSGEPYKTKGCLSNESYLSKYEYSDC